MSLVKVFFPEENRTFAGKRWVNIGLRTLHLIGIVGIGSLFLYQAPRDVWLPYLILTVVTGATMVLLELWTNGIWLIQLRGLATLIKLAILSLVFVFGLEAYIIYSVIIISSVFAHAPADVRYYSIFHGRCI